MLDKNFIQNYAQKNATPWEPRRVLTEYLQAEILAILYNSKFGKNLSFLGGTCLRFVHKIDRFSEDLDFDLVNLPSRNAEFDFEKLAQLLRKKASELGFSPEVKLKRTQSIWVLDISFLEIMKKWDLSSFDEQKIRIKFEIDPAPFENIRFESRPIFAYGKSFDAVTHTLETIFAQKIVA